MTTYLADSSVLIALSIGDHLHHRTALDWFETDDPSVATCPITQGALLRFLLRDGRSAGEALHHLELLVANPWHVFWPDDIAFSGDILDGVIGYRQVTDAYLVALAAHHRGRLVTLDRGLKALHPEVILLSSD
ncbi:MAG: PIN domain-containing protein [Actinobacteria bacterium]|nr:PIN domain-containing protein [Actinomycetota bacterium]